MVTTVTTTPSAANARPGEVSDFFGLAQELRDAIYDNLFVDEKHLERSPDVTYITRSAMLSMLMVNRQFKQEYGKRIPHFSQLEILDSNVSTIEMFRMNLPSRSYIATRLRLSIVVPSSGADASMHLEWIQDLITHLPQLRAVQLLALFESDEVFDDFLQHDVGDFTRLAKLVKASLAVQVEWEVRVDDWSSPQVQLAEWTPREGLVVDNAAREQWHKNTKTSKRKPDPGSLMGWLLNAMLKTIATRRTRGVLYDLLILLAILLKLTMLYCF